MSKTPLLDKGYLAGAAIAPYRIVKLGSADNQIVPAAASTAPVLGLSNFLGADAGEMADVTLCGIGEVQLGGTVTRDHYLVSDADGKAVAATVVAGTALYYVGKALQSGDAGDIIPVLVMPGCIANDVAVQIANVTITATELKALNATPKTLVAAPGAGKAIIPVAIQAFLDYATTAYDGIAAGEDLAFKYTNASGTQLGSIEATGFLDASADATRYVDMGPATAINPTANAALVAHMLTGEIATGDSPLKLRVHYRVIDVAL